MASYRFLTFKKYGYFLLYFILDLLVLLFVLLIRATADPHKFGIKFLFEPIVYVALPGLFIVQHLVVFWFFYSAVHKEDKYMLYPTDESGERSYHYFNPQQLLIFIEIASKSISGKDNDYDKIYVTNEPLPNIFSYNLFGKRTIVLHPTILQVAETQELRAGLVIDLELATKASIIRVYVSQHNKFFFIPFIGPILFYIREIAILIFFDPNADGNTNPLRTVLLMLFLIFFFFVLMTVISRVLAGLLNSANRNYMIYADLKAAEIVGARAVINYLLKLGHRQEAIEVILDEIQYLEELEKGKIIQSLERSRILKLVQMFPIASIDRNLAIDMAPEIFITQKIDVLERIYHCKFENREKIIANSVEQLLTVRRAFINDWKEKYKNDRTVQIPSSVDLQLMLDKCINIETFDLKSTLNDEEIAVLVEEILKKPRRKLFVHEPAKTSIFEKYPSTADQILAVNKLEFRG